MKEEDFKKECAVLIKKRMPKKRSVDVCVELLRRLSQKRARNPKYARTSDVSEGLPSARNHLNDMAKSGLVRKRSNEPIRGFIDKREPTNVRFIHGDVQISAVRKANIAELLRHISENEEVKIIALASVSACTILEFSEVIKNDDVRFNKVVTTLESKGLLDDQYNYGEMGWRTGSLLWCLTDDVPVME